MRPATNKDRYNFLIDQNTYNDFSLLCDEMGYVRSKIVEKSMKEFIEKNKDLVESLKGKNKK
jgi:hypothetical protein